jgi:hypothetical protein
MSRTILIYLAVLTFAEFSFTGRAAQAVDTNEVVVEPMKPVVADGKDVAPMIMDFTKNPDAEKPKPKSKKLVTAN